MNQNLKSFIFLAPSLLHLSLLPLSLSTFWSLSISVFYFLPYPILSSCILPLKAYLSNPGHVNIWTLMYVSFPVWDWKSQFSDPSPVSLNPSSPFSAAC